MSRNDAMLKARYRALARDWNRLRDIERDWRTLRVRVVYAFALVMSASAFAVIAGWL